MKHLYIITFQIMHAFMLKLKQRCYIFTHITISDLDARVALAPLIDK